MNLIFLVLDETALKELDCLIHRSSRNGFVLPVILKRILWMEITVPIFKREDYQVCSNHYLALSLMRIALRRFSLLRGST